jgi:flagellar biosynthesis activator protein FlaF
MSLQAYRRVAQQAETPREAEYRLFGQVTRALIDASQLDPTEISQRIDALHWNRELWTALASDCATEANQLPPELRARIISLSLWVSRHSSAVMRGEESFEPLIDVNRSVMQGLAAG